MTRRNFILLVIVLVIVVIAIFVFLFSQPNTTTPGGEGTGTNFFSQFNPFASNKTKTPVVTPPVTTPGTEPGTTPETTSKLIKISSMPIAGFGVFSKERIKVVPVVTPDPTLTLPLAGEAAKTPPKTTKVVAPLT